MVRVICTDTYSQVIYTDTGWRAELLTYKHKVYKVRCIKLESKLGAHVLMLTTSKLMLCTGPEHRCRALMCCETCGTCGVTIGVQHAGGLS